VLQPSKLCGLDPDRLDRAVAAVGLRRADALDDVLAAGDLAEDGVLAVEPRALVGGDDEELRAVGVGPALAIASAPRTTLWSLISSSKV
jgi:hypothetical protein